MATDDEWGRALRRAKRLYEERHDTDLTYKGMGRRLGQILGRAQPVPHPTVRSWFVDGQEPETFAVVRALAAMLETTPGDLLGDVPRSAADSTNGEPQAGQGVAPSGAPDVNQLQDDEPPPYAIGFPAITDQDIAEQAAREAAEPSPKSPSGDRSPSSRTPGAARRSPAKRGARAEKGKAPRTRRDRS